MKTISLILFFLINVSCPQTSIYAQSIPSSTEEQLETLADADQPISEDDNDLQELDRFRKNPVNLNNADVNEIDQLHILNDLQVESLISYRKLFGSFINIYELQAVPGWDIRSIRKILPFITIQASTGLSKEMTGRFRRGEHIILLKISREPERQQGFNKNSTGTKYLGSPQKIFFRYRYSYKNLLQFGLAADKDAGELFFKGPQNKGFDFYSFHLFARKLGLISELAVGDFTVNMGQGLIQWQSLAFKKSGEVMSVKRQSPTFRPYTSAGEFYFHRGVGITFKKRSVESSLFFSLRKLDGHLVNDSSGNEHFISSFLSSGYHRSTTENANRYNTRQTGFGGNILIRKTRWRLGLNAVHYHFSIPMHKADEPYNLYAISGNKWFNVSADYSYSIKNFHFFGEAAIDKNFSKAFINGVLISVDPRADLSLLMRSIDKSYQAVNANAFMENTNPTNETGFYAGITIRIRQDLKLDAYADIFKFPWLKYLVDAPSEGSEFLTQLSYTPNKQVEVYTRYKIKTKQTNQLGIVTHSLASIPVQSWRTGIIFKINNNLTLRDRVELISYDHHNINKEQGFTEFFDLIYKPMLKPYSVVTRLQYFETDGYNSRVYAFENDVLYSFSIPANSGKGLRYYTVLNFDISKKLSFWLRFAQTIYSDRKRIGSGLEEIKGNKESEIKIEGRLVI